MGVQVSGSTALHLAARWGHVEVIMELLLRGEADASVADIKGRTAEQVAAEYQRMRAAVRLRPINLGIVLQNALCSQSGLILCVCVLYVLGGAGRLAKR